MNVTQFRKQVNGFRRARGKFTTYSKVLLKVLEEARNALCPLAIVQTRTKTIPSFADKLSRKWGKYKKPLVDMTDLCGGRVIVSLRSELTDICDFIKDNFDIDEANSLDVASRLMPTQFGYRSVHYVVQFRRDAFPNSMINVEVPERIIGLKAEIQVRTMAQHAWSDVGHDRLYKSSFAVPVQFERESARIAALLEKADDSFADLVEGIETLQAQAASYMSHDQVRSEIERLTEVRRCDPTNARLLDRIAQLHIAQESWSALIQLLEEDRNAAWFIENPRLLAHLGFAYCEKHRNTPLGDSFGKGLDLQAEAAEMERKDVEIQTRLAECWSLQDSNAARENAMRVFEEAYRANPSNARALVGYLRHKVVSTNSGEIIAAVRPVIEDAIAKCTEQINVGLNLPEALYYVAELQILLGHSYAGLTAYARAVALSHGPAIIDQQLAGLHLLRPIERDYPEIDWARRLLMIAHAAVSSKGIPDELRKLASTAQITKPVVIVAGSCDDRTGKQIAGYEDLLKEAFGNFTGTVISGGTKEGVSGLVGWLTEQLKPHIHSIGYLPKMLPTDCSATKDDRYSEQRIGNEDGFCALQPLQYWIDLLARGIAPSQVALIGIGGGTISGFEYRLAAALGARVAVLESSGREADRVAAEGEWQHGVQVVVLPYDRMVVRAFVNWNDHTAMPPDVRDKLAKRLHLRYVAQKKKTLRVEQPSLAGWAGLPEELRTSNRLQADHIRQKLESLGMRLVPVAEDCRGKCKEIRAFNTEQVKLLAEMEHGRWVVERLVAGWTPGPRSDQAKRHDALVAWKNLSDDMKNLDIGAVADLPKLLRKVGLKICMDREPTE